ncbi:NADH:flavin oxidoreductase [Chloroflexota bacterium]
MPGLFNPFTINKLELENRFVRSATNDNLANEGMVTDAQVGLFRTLAQGEIGLIVTGGFYPNREGKGSPGQTAVDTDETIPYLRRLVNVVHENGGKIAAQIMHCGWLVRPEVSGFQPVGPSALVNPNTGIQVRELSGDEIHEIVSCYVQATRRVMEAGFDAVQIHGAHSWLISTFLSPATNKREDEWGGSLEKRANLVRRICQKIRKLAGPDYPLLVKLGVKDYHPEGKSTADGIETARLLEIDSVDAIEVSEGLEAVHGHHIRLDATSPYYVKECRQARRILPLPLILVGGMRKIQDMQAILDEGMADAISMCRPFIMDPHLVRKFRENSTNESDCTSCNGCRRHAPEKEHRCILVR